MKFQGKVSRRLLAGGSKSEHESVVLETPEGPLKLRRSGGNPFVDPELEKLMGREIICEGEIHAGQLFLTNWRESTASGE